MSTGISMVGSESEQLVSSKLGFAFGIYFEACKLQLFYSCQDVFIWKKNISCSPDHFTARLLYVAVSSYAITLLSGKKNTEV